jgi:DNA modification methylase
MRFGEGSQSPLSKGQVRECKKGTSRVSDVFTAHIANIDKGVMHPAMFPSTLSDQLVLTFSAPGDCIVDPFAGAGTVALSAVRHGRSFFGIDINPTYVQMASDRIKPGF